MFDLPKRKNIRLKDYDYSQNGAYFITICVRDREHIFGDIFNNATSLSHYGMIAANNINSISQHIKGVYVGQYVVMPNHVHMILVVNDIVGTPHVGTRYIVSEPGDDTTSEEKRAHICGRHVWRPYGDITKHKGAINHAKIRTKRNT